MPSLKRVYAASSSYSWGWVGILLNMGRSRSRHKTLGTEAAGRSANEGHPEIPSGGLRCPAVICPDW